MVAEPKTSCVDNMQHNERKFFLVWNPRKSTPKFKHDSYSEAFDEASRLAKKDLGEEFIILESIVSVVADLENIPLKQTKFTFI